VFVVREDKGRQPGIYQRTGRGGRAGLKLLYAFETQALIPASLQFIQIAKRTAEEEWPSVFEAALERAMRTAR
jgi:hypothetical protein